MKTLVKSQIAGGEDVIEIEMMEDIFVDDFFHEFTNNGLERYGRDSWRLTDGLLL